jgi:hypothetical protein
MTSWAIWQYHDSASGRGVVIAFRRPKSPFATVDITLKGQVAPELAVANLDDGETSVIRDGRLTLGLSLPGTSVILEYGSKE